MMTVTSKLMALVTALVTLISGSSAKDIANELYSQQAPDTAVSTIEELDPVKLCSEITIGWNLGNCLDATGGSGLNSETSWGNPKATEELILAVKKAGFNAVRIPTTWSNHLTDTTKYTIDPQWLDRVQEVVDYAYNNDLYVILNAHHENFNDPYESTYKKASKELCAIWKQVAARFKDYDERLIFEGQNEPRKRGTNVEWNGGDSEGRSVVNKLNADFVKTVRATGGNNEYRCLMVPTYAASAGGLDGFVLPDDKNLIVSIHAYTPYNFAMNYGGGTKRFNAALANSTSEINWLSSTLYEQFISKGVGVIIGETGATDKDNLEDRLEWAEYFTTQFKQYGIPIFLWDNNGFGVGDEKYGLIDRTTLQWKYPTYIKTLMKAANG